MVIGRACKGTTKDGGRCGARPMRDADLCFWHDPEHAEEAEQARRLGGQRRRRDKITEAAYDLDELDTVEAIRRVVQIGILDTLSLENSVNRNRTLFSGAMVLTKLVEVGEHEARLAEIEAALGPRLIGNQRRK